MGVIRQSPVDRPEVVFLDLGDTLVKPDPSWAEVYATAFDQFDIAVAREDFERAFADAFAEGQNDGPFEASEEASYRRLKDLDSRIFALLGYPDLPDAFFRRVEEAFARASSWWEFPDVLPALDALLGAGIRLGVISNWSWQAPELLHDLELARHFEALVISARVGYLKPHRRIFEHALEVMKVEPARAMHVGDSIHADVEGARRAGMRAVLIDRSTHVHGRGSHRASLPPDVPVVADLGGLLDVVGIARAATSAVS